MGASAPVAQKANGLSNVVNVLTAPREAMESLRVAPTWGWAFLIAAILSCLGQYLLTPAVSHAMQASWPAQVAARSTERIRSRAAAAESHVSTTASGIRRRRVSGSASSSAGSSSTIRIRIETRPIRTPLGPRARRWTAATGSETSRPTRGGS